MKNLRRKEDGPTASDKLSRQTLNTRTGRLVNSGSTEAAVSGVSPVKKGQQAGQNAKKAAGHSARTAQGSTGAAGSLAEAGLHAGKSSFHATRAGARVGAGVGAAGKDSFSHVTDEEDINDNTSKALTKIPNGLKNASHLPKKFRAGVQDVKAAGQEIGKSASSMKRAAGDTVKAGKRVKDAAKEAGKGGKNLRTVGAGVRQRTNAKKASAAVTKTGETIAQIGSQIGRGARTSVRMVVAVTHAIRAAVAAVTTVISSTPILLTIVAVVTVVIVVIATLGWILPGVEEERKKQEQQEALPLACGNGINGQPVAIPDEYLEAVKKSAATAGLPVSVIAAQLQQESNWDPNAQSPVGARGIGQFMPGTWEQYGNGKDPFDALAGIDAQGRFMADIRKTVSSLGGSEEEIIKWTLAGYNAGPGAVLQFGGIPPFEETQDYVRIIIEASQIECDSQLPTPLDLGPGEWASLLPGSRLTSPFGPRGCPLTSCIGQPYLLFHEGIDLAGGGSQYFYAPTDMKITYVGRGPSDPLWSFYGEYIYAVQEEAPHLVFEFHEAAAGSLLVNSSNVGDVVPAGTPLGQPGATGNSSGRHLHFQINKPGTDVSGPTVQNGMSLDPLPFLTKKGIAP